MGGSIDAARTTAGAQAIVAGAGMAGLLTAAVLADHFARVVIVERDQQPAGAEPRRGVPQGRHAHALLPRGHAALQCLFPDFAETAVAAGALGANAATDALWGLGGYRLAAAPDVLPVIVSTRPFLEQELRRHVSALANVEFIYGAREADFVLDRGSVVGMQIERSGALERLDASLVVDATGRASRLPAWLEAHGFAAPSEETMEVDVGYATARFRADVARLAGLRAVIVGATPACPRAGIVHAVEGGMIEVSLTGYRKEHPPNDPAGFVAHAASLALPDIHRLIQGKEPCSEIATFRVARTVWRHYEKLDRRLPPGIIAMGDAICAFNPVFAQGMTVAALQALALRETFRRVAAGPQHPSFARHFYRRAAQSLAPAWQMARGNDLLIPHLAHHASLPDRLMSRWIKRVLSSGAHDPEVARRFIRVASLMDAPAALLAPGMIRRVLFGSRMTTGQPQDCSQASPSSGRVQ